MSVKKSGCPVKKRQPLFLRATPVNAGITGVRPIFCLVFFDEEGFAGVGTNHRLCPPASDACPEVRLNFQLFPPANHHTLFKRVLNPRNLRLSCDDVTDRKRPFS